MRLPDEPHEPGSPAEPIIHQIDRGPLLGNEVSQRVKEPLVLPPYPRRRLPAEPLLVRLPLAPDIHGRRRALHNVDCFDKRARCGSVWTVVAPVPMIATRLSFSFERDGFAGVPRVTSYA